ncbi:hypothetical protein EVAR_14894_1 [Eumeta japonica]|uniref:Uncharacterized protein n=1 Tax=Eumeta variegata TaxID=151549 RepID=A0A4C1V313_EUMVA|nr:hypothetical protein EVAR_14894_1 [Eumeta japonica]
MRSLSGRAARCDPVLMHQNTGDADGDAARAARRGELGRLLPTVIAQLVFLFSYIIIMIYDQRRYTCVGKVQTTVIEKKTTPTADVRTTSPSLIRSKRNISRCRSSLERETTRAYFVILVA